MPQNIINEEEDIAFKKFDSVIEYTEMVEELLTLRPDARKKSIYKEWINEINFYASEANKLANYPIYGKFK